MAVKNHSNARDQSFISLCVTDMLDFFVHTIHCMDGYGAPLSVFYDGGLSHFDELFVRIRNGIPIDFVLR